MPQSEVLPSGQLQKGWKSSVSRFNHQSLRADLRITIQLCTNKLCILKAKWLVGRETFSRQCWWICFNQVLKEIIQQYFTIGYVAFTSRVYVNTGNTNQGVVHCKFCPVPFLHKMASDVQRIPMTFIPMYLLTLFYQCVHNMTKHFCHMV